MKWYKHEVMAPLIIGFVIFGVGYVLEYEPLAWVGLGINLFGWFVALRD
jgi:hypothetical protein